MKKQTTDKRPIVSARPIYRERNPRKPTPPGSKSARIEKTRDAFYSWRKRKKDERTGLARVAAIAPLASVKPERVSPVKATVPLYTKTGLHDRTGHKVILVRDGFPLPTDKYGNVKRGYYHRLPDDAVYPDKLVKVGKYGQVSQSMPVQLDRASGQYTNNQVDGRVKTNLHSGTYMQRDVAIVKDRKGGSRIIPKRTKRWSTK